MADSCFVLALITDNARYVDGDVRSSILNKDIFNNVPLVFAFSTALLPLLGTPHLTP